MDLSASAMLKEHCASRITLVFAGLFCVACGGWLGKAFRALKG